MNARKPAAVLSFFLITAVCGLVLASHSKIRQSLEAAHNANNRGHSSSGAQWRWQNPLPQENNLRGVSLVEAITGTPWLGIAIQLFEQQMAGTRGRSSRAVQRKRYGVFPSRILTMDRLSAKMGRSSGPQTVALIGCRKPVERC